MRRIGVEAMEALAGLREEGEQTSFTTAEIAKRLGIEAWRVRRSLKSMAADEFALVWSDGGDRWCIDPRLVKLLRYVKDIEELKDKA
jgi:DNA-binding IclR family transcriptional regulator